MTASTNCRACGSRALLNVARALDRQRPSDLPASTAIVQRFGTRVRARAAFDDGANLGRNRARESAFPRKLDLNMSENSA
jgi:hypothetical protein